MNTLFARIGFRHIGKQQPDRAGSLGQIQIHPPEIWASVIVPPAYKVAD